MAGLARNPVPCYPPYASHHMLFTSFSSMLAYMSNEKTCSSMLIVFLAPHYRHDGGFIYARKMAAKAARPAMAIELPVVLAAPLKAWMGELVGLGTAL